MPTVAQNLRRWTELDWSERGAQWCAGFGGVQPAWDHAILPRIGPFLPAQHILELGPGYGLWTDYLRPTRGPHPFSTRMTLVDVTPNCIEACAKRFGHDGVSYVVNDGSSLAEVEDDSIDFVFSFNSLVHADHAVMREYARQLARKMKPGAFGFVHHSNLGACLREVGPDVQASGGGGDGRGKVPKHWRGQDMTGQDFRSDCRETGLICVFQEIIPWGSNHFIDALSLIYKPAGDAQPEERVEQNPEFWRQARAGNHAPQDWYRDAQQRVSELPGKIQTEP